MLKCRALTKKSWIDDLEIDEEGVADILMGKLQVKNDDYFKQLNTQSIMLRDQEHHLHDHLPLLRVLVVSLKL